MTFILLSFIVFGALVFALGFDFKAPYIQGRMRPWRVQGKQALAFFAFLLILPAFFASVEGNQVGIIYDPLKGGIQSESFGEGLHVKSPLASVHNISTKLREANFEMSAQTGRIIHEDDQGNIEETGGGQWATYEVTLQYRVEVMNAHLFYRNFGSEGITRETLEARVRQALQANSVKHDIFSILKGDLNLVRLDTENQLRETLADLGITVESFIIRDVDAGPAIEQVVQDEATAAKQREIALKEQEAQMIREETSRLAAEIQAQKRLIEAEAQAEAERLLYSVTATAINRMYIAQFMMDSAVVDQALKTDFEVNGIGGFLTIQEITDIVIKQLYFDTWDGKLPEVIAGDASGLIFNLG